MSDRAAEPAPRSFASSARVFARYTSPRILIVAAASTLVVRLALGGFTPWDLLIPTALLALWPIQEWLIHVVLLHWRPRRVLGVMIDPLVSRKHREHHLQPRHIPLLFIPVHTWWLSGPAVLAAWLLTMPTLELAWTGIAAYFALALHYEWSHFVAHVPWTPRLYRRISRSHNLHHYKSEKHWFGVSMLAGDRLLGTRADPRTLPTSATVRTLGVELDQA
jgi:hypothetical protein